MLRPPLRLPTVLWRRRQADPEDGEVRELRLPVARLGQHVGRGEGFHWKDADTAGGQEALRQGDVGAPMGEVRSEAECFQDAVHVCRQVEEISGREEVEEGSVDADRGAAGGQGAPGAQGHVPGAGRQQGRRAVPSGDQDGSGEARYSDTVGPRQHTQGSGHGRVGEHRLHRVHSGVHNPEAVFPEGRAVGRLPALRPGRQWPDL
mmetsp:Transcript_4819/g.13660  ORF Transcript_4819/g.13660 Transcript_4819/m.13660 type:complete len:205 (+) Transcript_4819:789-1403(+)